jgi:methylated-DNA-[protein]-cysteine S-methyltransferase
MGRPEREHRSAQREGNPVTAMGRLTREHRSAQREGNPATVMAVPWAAKLRTPFAVLGIRTGDGCLTGVEFLPLTERAQQPVDTFAARVVAEIQHYLADPRHRFTLPLAPAGTPFQRRVWRAIDAIPPGESRTYGELARSLRSGPRAVGNACGANPIALVTPCHRVVGSRGALGGFARTAKGEALSIKRWLLTHEGYRFGA